MGIGVAVGRATPHMLRDFWKRSAIFETRLMPYRSCGGAAKASACASRMTAQERAEELVVGMASADGAPQASRRFTNSSSSNNISVHPKARHIFKHPGRSLQAALQVIGALSRVTTESFQQCKIAPTNQMNCISTSARAYGFLRRTNLFAIKNS